MARERTVYPTDEVCHLWANRRTEGRDIRNSSGNVSTRSRGSILCSYGSHFAIGAFIDHPKKPGETLLLLNRANYSHTTRRHQSAAYRAIPGYLYRDAIRVPSLSENDANAHSLPTHADALAREAAASLVKSQRARVRRPYFIASARTDLVNAARLLTFAGRAKAAANVPTIPDDPTKEQVVAIIVSIARAEYMGKAREALARAEDAQGIARTSPRSAAYRIDHAKSAIQRAHLAADHYKTAGSKPAPMVARIVCEMQTLIEVLTPIAKRDAENEARERLSEAAGDAYLTIRARGRREAWAWMRAIKHLHGAAMPAEWIALDRRFKAVTRCERLRDAIDEAATPAGALRHAWANVAPYLTPRGVAYWQPRALAALAAANERERIEREEQMQRHADAIERWRAGESVRLPHVVPTMARIKGDEVETSRGARVPLGHAVRLVKIAQRIAQRGGQDWQPGGGPRVGHYQVQRIGADLGATIGCHEFTPDESARIVAAIVAHSAYMGTDATADEVAA